MTARLMTYAELAETWGVSKEAARKKVEGLGLPKQMGNDGRARIMVDLTEHQHEPMRSRSSPRRAGGDQVEGIPETGDLRRLVSALEAEVTRLNALGASQRADFERERDRADVLSVDLSTLRAALSAMTDERDAARARAAQVAVLEAVLELERQRLAETRQEAERWREMATAPRGFWAWIRRT